MEFPENPEIGDTYSYAGRTWQWSGQAWEFYDSTAVPTAPSVPNASGLPGQIAYENGFLYVCTAPGTWGRLELTQTWYPGEGIDGTLLTEADEVLTTESDDPILF